MSYLNTSLFAFNSLRVSFSSPFSELIDFSPGFGGTILIGGGVTNTGGVLPVIFGSLFTI